MKKVTVILLAMILATVAFADTDPIKDLDTEDYVISEPSRIVIDGVLTGDAPIWHRWRPNSYGEVGLNCDLVMTSDYSSEPHFDQYCFNVSTDDPVEFVVTEADFDTVIYIYCDPFDPADATENAVKMDDDNGVGLLSAITAADGVTLVPGDDYWFIITSYSAGSTGNYSVQTSDNVTLCGVANDGSTWSSVKGLYR